MSHINQNKFSDFGLPNVRRPDDDPELGDQFGSIREKRINRLGVLFIYRYNNQLCHQIITISYLRWLL